MTTNLIFVVLDTSASTPCSIVVLPRHAATGATRTGRLLSSISLSIILSFLITKYTMRMCSIESLTSSVCGNLFIRFYASSFLFPFLTPSSSLPASSYLLFSSPLSFSLSLCVCRFSFVVLYRSGMPQ